MSMRRKLRSGCWTGVESAPSDAVVPGLVDPVAVGLSYTPTSYPPTSYTPTSYPPTSGTSARVASLYW